MWCTWSCVSQYTTRAATVKVCDSLGCQRWYCHTALLPSNYRKMTVNPSYACTTAVTSQRGWKQIHSVGVNLSALPCRLVFRNLYGQLVLGNTTTQWTRLYLVGSLQIGRCYSALVMHIVPYASIFRLCCWSVVQCGGIIVNNHANTHTEVLAANLGVQVHWLMSTMLLHLPLSIHTCTSSFTLIDQWGHRNAILRFQSSLVH